MTHLAESAGSTPAGCAPNRRGRRQCHGPTGGRIARAVVVLVVAVGLLSAQATWARGLGLPGGPEVTVDEQNISLFIRHADMGSCQMAYFSNCFRFADGTVVGQTSILAPLVPLFNLFAIPLDGCTRVPQLGASPDVVEVYAGSGLPLIVGTGDCSSLLEQLADGTAYLVVPGVGRTIEPTAASVRELNVAGG